MSLMQKNESFERFSEGLKKSISRAKELGVAQDNYNWTKIAILLEGLLNKGIGFYNAKQISRQDTLAILDQLQKDIKH